MKNSSKLLISYHKSSFSSSFFNFAYSYPQFFKIAPKRAFLSRKFSFFICFASRKARLRRVISFGNVFSEIFFLELLLASLGHVSLRESASRNKFRSANVLLGKQVFLVKSLRFAPGASPRKLRLTQELFLRKSP
jgi:hypothetical protein